LAPAGRVADLPLPQPDLSLLPCPAADFSLAKVPADRIEPRRST